MGKLLHKSSHGCRKIWVKMNLPFLSDVIAASTWRAMGWACDERPNAVVNPLKQVSTEAVEMKKDPFNTRDGNISGGGTTVGASGTSWLLNGPVMRS